MVFQTPMITGTPGYRSVLFPLQAQPHEVNWEGLNPNFTSKADAVTYGGNSAPFAIPGANWGKDVWQALISSIVRIDAVSKTDHTTDGGRSNVSQKRSPSRSEVLKVLTKNVGYKTPSSDQADNAIKRKSAISPLWYYHW